MKKTLLILGTAGLLFSACNKGFETTEEGGVQYKILSHEEGAREIKPDEMLMVNLRITTESKDSVIMETFTTNTLQYIEAGEPNLKGVFAVSAKGDSIEVLMNADSLFQKSFHQPKPAWMKDEANVRFIIKVVDVLDQKEISKKKMEKEMEMMARIEEAKTADSLALKEYVAGQKNVKTTASGLMYMVEKEGKGKKTKSGDNVSVNYKGYFMNGEVFDQNRGGKPANMQVGLGQVIPGLEEALELMNEGAKYKLIIPWKLAYGERGADPVIPPCTSILFDVEVIKIN